MKETDETSGGSGKDDRIHISLVQLYDWSDPLFLQVRFNKDIFYSVSYFFY